MHSDRWKFNGAFIASRTPLLDTQQHIIKHELTNARKRGRAGILMVAQTRLLLLRARAWNGQRCRAVLIIPRAQLPPADNVGPERLSTD